MMTVLDVDSQLLKNFMKWIINLQNNPHVIFFRDTTDDESISEIITYNQLLDRIDSDDGKDEEWIFKAIVDHQRPLMTIHKY